MSSLPIITKRMVPGFTILEIMVALVITGIVASMATWAFSNIDGYVQMYRKNENQNLDFARFVTHMHTDIHAAKEIEYNNQRLILLLPDQEVYYRFFNDVIVRSSQVADDSLFLTTTELHINPLAEYPDVIESIALTIQMGKVRYPMTFTKNYSRQQLFGFAYGYTD